MEETETNQTTKCNRRAVQASTTLSRRYTERPKMGEDISVQRSPQITRFEVEQPVDLACPQAAQPVNVLADPVTELIDGESDSLMIDDFDEVSTDSATLVDNASNIVVNRLHESTPEQVALSQQVAQLGPDDAQMAAPNTAITPEMVVAPEKTGSAKESLSRVAAEQIVRHPMQISANASMKKRSIKVQDMDAPKVSARELKEQAIRRAMAAASQTEDAKSQAKSQKSKKSRKTKKVQTMHFGFGRVMLALGCATAAVMAVVYFVNMNMPDISLRVAAMQTGIDPSYPTYVPRNYSVSGITSREGEIRIDFINSVDNKSFSLTEQKSSWDTNALLANFVKSEYGDDYTTVKEQGLTIYISGSNAAWVNGGNVYKIEATSNTLTNKQIKSIAVSL